MKFRICLIILLAINISECEMFSVIFLFVISESNCDNENNKDKEMSKAKVDQPVDLRKKYEPDQMASSSVVKCVVRLDDTYDKINEDKTASTESGKVEARQRNAEYESDSDDENLSSVISVTFSITSESEEDENFVVVPMPPCFMCDAPLDKSSKFYI